MRFSVTYRIRAVAPPGHVADKIICRIEAP